MRMCHCRAFSLMEVMVTMLIISMGATAMLGGLSQQSDMRASTLATSRTLDLVTGIRERLDSLRFTEIGRPATAGSPSWTAADPYDGSTGLPDPLADGILNDADGGLGESDLRRAGPYMSS